MPRQAWSATSLVKGNGGRTPNQLIKSKYFFCLPIDNNRKKSARVTHNSGLLISNKSNRSQPTRLAKTKAERMNNILLFYLFSLIYVK
jgi:hypothetical protein